MDGMGHTHSRDGRLIGLVQQHELKQTYSYYYYIHIKELEGEERSNLFVYTK